jgi:CyaY protein
LEVEGEGAEAADDDAAGAGLGNVSGPFWPHADKAESAANKEPAAVIVMTREAKLWRRFNIASILTTMSTELVPTPLTDSEYRAKTAAVLASIEAAVDRWLQDDVVDIDTQRTGGLLELSFPNGSKIVLNTQPPLHELWMAARSGGYHYKYVDGRWLDTREAHDFFDALSACSSEQAGVALKFVGAL